jgi:ABC-type microcin C transport system duplicated ATPase subunit YejF
MAPLLAIQNLSVRFRTGGRWIEATRGVDIAVARGETIALVGESGSGKTQTMMAAIGLLPPNGEAAGSVRFADAEILGADQKALGTLRGSKITFVFQEPASALDPLYSVGAQIMAPLRVHQRLSRQAAGRRALELMALVGLDRPEQRFKAAPHQLSGGQRQRVMIAMAIANDPALLIADEPTTALDATLQTQILSLLADLQRRLGMAMVFITHDIALTARIAARTYVMARGEVVESGPTSEVLARPRAGATRVLVEATPPGAKAPSAASTPVLLEARDIVVDYAKPVGSLFGRRSHLRAVDGVSFDLREGQTLGIVGESGSGKSTLARAVLALTPHRGVVRFDGRDLAELDAKALRAMRRDMQLVLQDPFGSLSPRLTVGAIVGEALLVHEPSMNAAARAGEAARQLSEVGLDPALSSRYPHELSGGQRQRVAIARAMILRPRLIILDEPTSALDRSVQKELLTLLRAQQDARGFAYIFISHDLAVIRAMADEILVMRRGIVVERGPANAILDRPRQDYTQSLIAAAVSLGLRPER